MDVTFGRYRLLERLGQGGMAEVFKAKSYGVEGFEKVVVIKRILPQLARSAEFVEMFIHEAKLSVRLSHANIVQVFDLGLAPTGADGTTTPADAYYMAMEYVNGPDLATLLARARKTGSPLPLPTGVYVAAEVAKGLDHAHRRRDEGNRPLGVVHRDVSPQNVLLSLEGEVKVADFGIAKARGAFAAASEDTSTRTIQGKFAYMSPEQVRAGEVDARSDLFSLGIVLYECIAGANPFSSASTFETLRRVQACEYPPVELLRPDVPPELVAIQRMAMAPKPEDRYQDAGSMYEALLAFLYGQGRRYGAHQLSELLSTFREDEDSLAPAGIEGPLFDHDPSSLGQNDRTPLELPYHRQSYSYSGASSSRPLTADLKLSDRPTDRGERREVTALALELPRRARTRNGQARTDREDLEDESARAALILERYGGRVVVCDPEQVAAIFGLDEPDGRDTEVATRCALVALRTLDGPEQPSAGLHVGRIHVSADGEPTDDDRLSTLVQTARELARMREGRCAISSAALRQVRSLFSVEAPGDHASGPMPTIANSAYQLVKDVRGPAEAFGRFVGRKDELRRIGEVLASATKRRARILTVRGDHGVGKTRLLFEVERRLRKGGYNVGWYLATCPPRGREFPLSGILCMLQTLCGVAEGDSLERILAVAPRLRALGLHDDEVSAVLSALGADLPAAAGSNAKSILRNAFARMVQSLADDRPQTFAWDVAHAMDSDSFALIESAFERLQNARVVFAFSARAGFAHTLEKLPAHTAIDLRDLKEDDAERLVEQRLGVDDAPASLVSFVRERAGGHPLFIEEVLKGLVETRAVTVNDRHITGMKLVGQDLALPKTLRGLVASRIARLSPADRVTLQAAAVLGDPIHTAILAAMVGSGLGALERSLAVLKERDFVVQTGPSELRFSSPIVREVVVDALPHQAAREMHAAAGAGLEQLLGTKAWEQAARIATHYYEAGDRPHAADYFGKSGDRRLEAKQFDAATRDYARAIELSDIAASSPEALSGWLSGLAHAVRLVRTLPEATEMCDRVLVRLDAAGTATQRVKARIDAGRILGALHHLEAARSMFGEAERVARGDDALVKQVLVAMAELASQQGDFKRSRELLERVQNIVVEAGDRQEEHKALINLAQSYAATGERQLALDYLRTAEALLPNDATSACERQKHVGLVEYFARDWQAAAAAADKAVDQARALGLTYEVAVNLHNQGDSLMRNGELAPAYGALQQSLALCEESGYERLAMHNRMFLAFLDAANGDQEAERQLGRGVRYAEAHDYTWDVIGGRLLQAQLFARRGERDSARLEFERLRDIARTSGNRLVMDDCDMGLRALDSAG